MPSLEPRLGGWVGGCQYAYTGGGPSAPGSVVPGGGGPGRLVPGGGGAAVRPAAVVGSRRSFARLVRQTGSGIGRQQVGALTLGHRAEGHAALSAEPSRRRLAVTVRAEHRRRVEQLSRLLEQAEVDD